MPRFFFNVQNEHWLPDKQGVEMTSPDDAKHEAQRLARLLPRSDGHAAAGHNNATAAGHKNATIVVTDESGATVCQVTVW